MWQQVHVTLPPFCPNSTVEQANFALYSSLKRVRQVARGLLSQLTVTELLRWCSWRRTCVVEMTPIQMSGYPDV